MIALKKGTSNAESVTLSFWVKSNKTGTYTIEWRDADNNRHICASYTISSSDTWEKKTITFAGDTISPFVYDNSSCGNIAFNLAAGSSFTSGTLATSWASRDIANLAVGQVNLADATSNYWQITGIQLEVGEGASDFEFLPYDVQLQRCQRYYQKILTTSSSDRQMIGAGHYNGGTSLVIPYQHYGGIMRASPTASVSALNLLDLEPFDVQPAAVGFGDVTKFGCWINVTDTTSRTMGFAGSLFLDISGAFVSFDAEL